jgi:hypothetical protein
MASDTPQDINRVRDVLARDYSSVDAQLVDQIVREEFAARSTAPIKEFVGVFVERSARPRLRNLPGA